MKPTKEEFKHLARDYPLVPVWETFLFDVETPISLFRRIGEKEKYAFLLESAERGEILGRYSFIGYKPSSIIVSKEDEDPIPLLRKLILTRKAPTIDELPPFTGGAVGYISYDAVRLWEKLPSLQKDDLNLPISTMMIFPTILIMDHLKRELTIVHMAEVGSDPEESFEKGKKIVQKVKNIIQQPNNNNSYSNEVKMKTFPNELQTTMSDEEFIRAVEKAKEYIYKGDIFQVVLSRRFSKRFEGNPFDVYRILHSINPSPYMFYLKMGDLAMVGSSPEIMVRVHNGVVFQRPIAGTRPRGKTVEEDKELENDLLNDEKERAEHLMLVDLARNDVGKVCEYGSVQVSKFMVIERYSHVMHIVSYVEGRLRKDKDALDALQASFPAGTVSGAPKVRAMEIIEELEPVKRGPYAGVVGYVGFNGNLDTCITIRTALFYKENVYIQAGAGIVADSSPNRELLEIENKAKALLTAIERYKEGYL
ncbi:anthranilate synthase component I [bacterium]|nr:anthranilate synthase component I [bacterium]